jgi:hypothetical protein
MPFVMLVWDLTLAPFARRWRRWQQQRADQAEIDAVIRASRHRDVGQAWSSRR